MAATFNPFTGQLDFTGGSSSIAAFTSGTATGLTSLGLRSTGAAFDLTLASAEVLTAGRTLTFNVGDANRTLTIPATGTVAMLGVANVFTLGQTIQGAVGASALTLTGATQTASFPVLNATQTWNNAAVAFDGLNFDVTNTASDAASKLLNLRVGGVSKFAISAGGDIQPGSDRAIQLLTQNGTFVASIGSNGDPQINANILGINFSRGKWDNSGLWVAVGRYIGFTDSEQGGTIDTRLYRRAAAYLGLGTASAIPISQTFGGAEAVGTDITGGVLNFGTRGTGSGVGGVINFQSHAAGSTGTTLGTLVNVLSIIRPGVIRITNIPTSSAGLSTGDVWSNAGVLTIV